MHSFVLSITRNGKRGVAMQILTGAWSVEILAGLRVGSPLSSDFTIRKRLFGI